jgi:hypothetical protein
MRLLWGDSTRGRLAGRSAASRSNPEANQMAAIGPTSSFLARPANDAFPPLADPGAGTKRQILSTS